MFDPHPWARRLGELALLVVVLLAYDTMVIHELLLTKLAQSFPQMTYLKDNVDWIFPSALGATLFLLLYGTGSLDRWLNPNSAKFQNRITARARRG